MELYNVETSAEKILQAKADKLFIPLGGAMELLPLCNMDCKMCYVKKTKAQMEAEGRMLSCDEWLRIADEGVKQGMLFLLLTGGEPLIYPEFKRLYAELKRKGLVLSVNTNGTLLDEGWADFFAEQGCQRVSITLYGKDDATYAALCGNPRGFTQVMNACRLLKERNVPLRLTCSVTPNNVDQLDDLHAIARELDVPMIVSSYMFPASRRGVDSEDQYRVTPERAAAAIIRCNVLEKPELSPTQLAINSLAHLSRPSRHYQGKGYSCHAGRSGFWLNWKGEMMPCGLFEEPKMSLLEHSFEECWKYIVDYTQAMTFCGACEDCALHNACFVCPANCYTETGDPNGRPEYLCRMIKEEVRLLKEHLFRQKVL